MDGTERKKIAEGWLNFQRNWWAWDRLDELCRDDPGAAWAVLTDMVQIADSRELVEDIGVGPLEDFLNNHGGDFIDTVETEAHANEALSGALSYVQVRDATHPAARRLAALGCRLVAAGQDAKRSS